MPPELPETTGVGRSDSAMQADDPGKQELHSYDQ